MNISFLEVLRDLKIPILLSTRYTAIYEYGVITKLEDGILTFKITNPHTGYYSISISHVGNITLLQNEITKQFPLLTLLS